ncbi:MAG: NAD(P)-binding protein, partial [Thermodesulfobacteriota bacterium]|nr:NAD(P)-binding protein [Thermodesulfobacteriota bacterium]
MREERYDAVVIGAGISGLSAASILAHEGYKILVAERLPIIGGRCSSVEHKGYIVTTGAIMMEGLLNDFVFKRVGAPFDIRIPDPQFHYYIDGKSYPLPEKGKIRAAITIASGKDEADKIMAAIRRAVTWQEPSYSISFYEWLRQHTENEKTIGVFRGSWDLNHMPAGEAIGNFKKMGPVSESGYAVGGNIALMKSLADVVEANHGAVWTRCQAKQILVENGATKGVILFEKEEER